MWRLPTGTPARGTVRMAAYIFQRSGGTNPGMRYNQRS